MGWLDQISQIHNTADDHSAAEGQIKEVFITYSLFLRSNRPSRG